VDLQRARASRVPLLLLIVLGENSEEMGSIDKLIVYIQELSNCISISLRLNNLIH
jgi:hypothetical protein